MALPTLTELLRPKTREGWRDYLLGQLGAAGFRVTSWPDGGTARGLVEAAAAGLADVQAGIVEVTKGGLLDLAEGGWLTLLAKSVFDVDRKPSTFTEGWVTLTAAAGAGPYTITAGSFWAGQQGSGTTDAKSVSGARSDTTLIAHLSGDRKHVTVVSIPRDSMVPMPPNCDAKVPKQNWTVQQFNAAYSLGGPASADVAAKAVALAVVANALDDLESFDVQDAARAILAAYQPAGALPDDIKPQNLMTLGSGRRRQVVSTTTDMVQENHVGWLIRQVMKRQIGPQEALSRTIKAVRRRGPRESLALLTASIVRLIRPSEAAR